MTSIIFRALMYIGVGVVGEIIFTAVRAWWKNGDWRLQGYTQLWVFPLYASAVLVFEPLHAALRTYPFLLRGLVYALVIFLFEYSMGFVAKRLTGRCPWEYTGRWHVQGYINLPHAPFWMLLGLIFERLHDFLLTIKLI